MPVGLPLQECPCRRPDERAHASEKIRDDTRLIIRGFTMENYSDRLLKMALNSVSQS
jgi:hypothetical protein